MSELCSGVEGPIDGRRPIYYDEIALVRFERYDETRYTVVIVTEDGRKSIIARKMGHYLAEHLIDGLTVNGVPVWVWDAQGEV